MVQRMVLEQELNVNRTQMSQIRIFNSLLKNNTYKNVLEIGCNKGIWTYIFSEHFENVILSDISNHCQVDDLINKGLNPIFIKADGSRLPFKSNIFDLVFSIDVIEHVIDDTSCFNEHVRVCKDGGTVIIGTPNLNRITNRMRKAIGRLKFPEKLGVDIYGDIIHIREYCLNDLYTILTSLKNIADFEITPCQLTIGVNMGVSSFPTYFNKFCQFWFVKIKKKI
jgi:SAM-dependent methyltransferase